MFIPGWIVHVRRTVPRRVNLRETVPLRRVEILVKLGPLVRVTLCGALPIQRKRIVSFLRIEIEVGRNTLSSTRTVLVAANAGTAVAATAPATPTAMSFVCNVSPFRWS